MFEFPFSCTYRNRTTDVCRLHVQSNIRYRYAHTLVSSEVCNTADVGQEVAFSLTLPETAFISSFSIEIEGRVYNAYVKGKEEAQRIYTDAVQHGRTAGHVAVSARDSNCFNVSVNVERQKKVIFRLTYEELLSRKLGMYKHIINLDPGQIVKDFSITVNIEESTDITELKVATLKQNELQSDPSTEIGSSLANIERPNPHTVIVRFAPTPEQQQTLSRDGIRGQFIVQYDVDRSALHSQILVNDGYFAHYFAPEQLNPLPKHVTFVLDISGSMHGRKIDQLKEAMEKILSDLLPQDYFSLLIFNSGVQVWRLVGDGRWEIATIQESDCRSLVVPATPENILRGKLAIYKLNASGNTNIHLAMMTATNITQLRKKLEISQSPEPILIFLTDGQPTTGICHRDEIIFETTRLNQIGKATIFTLGLGNDVDFDFLKKLALRNSGFCRRIYEASDTALQLRDFYREVSSPLLSNITFIYQPEQVESISVTRHNFVTFFRGSELIVSGCIDPSVSELDFRFGVTGNSSEGIVNFQPEETRVVFLKKPGFMERLWAYLTIQQLLEEEMKLEGQMSSEKKHQAMQLALKYSFVTPVTSLVVVRPDDQHFRATLGSEMRGMQNTQFMSPPSGGCFGSFGSPAIPPHNRSIGTQGFGVGFQQQAPVSIQAPTFGGFGRTTIFGQGFNGLSFSSGQTTRNQAVTGSIFGSGQPRTNAGHGLFGSGQNATNQSHGLFGSGQPTTNQGHVLSAPFQNTTGFTFGFGQVTTNQEAHGLFGSGHDTTNQGLTGFTFGSGQERTNQGLTGFSFGSGQATATQGQGFIFEQNDGRQNTDVIKVIFTRDKVSNSSMCKICNGLVLGDNPDHLERHVKVAHPPEQTTSIPKSISAYVSEKHLNDVLSDIEIADGRPHSVLSDSFFKNIIDPIASVLNISVTPELIRQIRDERSCIVEQIISKELTNAFVSLQLEIVTKHGQEFIAVHAHYNHAAKKFLRTLTMKKLNPNWDKNDIVEIVTSTLQKFGIKTVFFVTINTVKYNGVLNESSRDAMSKVEKESDADDDDKFFKIVLDACSMMGMSGFWSPTYTMQAAVHHSAKTHQGISLLQLLENLKLSSNAEHQLTGTSASEISQTATEQKEISSFEEVARIIDPLLTCFQERKWHFGDIFSMWLKCKRKISKLGTPFAETFCENMEKCAKEILKNPVFQLVLFIDPRYKVLLNNEQRHLAIEELKRLWCTLSSLKDMGFTSNEAAVVEKLKLFESIPQRSEDTDILKYWESQKENVSDLKKLAKILLSVPILQDTVERLSLNFDMMSF